MQVIPKGRPVLAAYKLRYQRRAEISNFAV